MGTVSAYCFICAQDKEDAKYAVNSFLEDRMGKEFYDGFTIQDGPGDIQLLSNFYDNYFTPLYATSQSLLQQFREEAEKARELEDRVGEAGALRRASDLLYESKCPAMPWFNIEGGDFFLPSDKQGWWAVMVEFY
jgi:hypothetical protein